MELACWRIHALPETTCSMANLSETSILPLQNKWHLVPLPPGLGQYEDNHDLWCHCHLRSSHLSNVTTCKRLRPVTVPSILNLIPPELDVPKSPGPPKRAFKHTSLASGGISLIDQHEATPYPILQYRGPGIRLTSGLH